MTMIRRSLDELIYSDYFYDEVNLAKRRLPEDNYINRFLNSESCKQGEFS